MLKSTYLSWNKAVLYVKSKINKIAIKSDKTLYKWHEIKSLDPPPQKPPFTNQQYTLS